MTPDEVLAAFEEHGVVLRGHFELTSGRHSDVYIQKQRAFEDPRLTMRLAEAIVERVGPGSFDVVASPAVGAISLGAFVAYVAGARFVYTERDGGRMTLRRGQRLEPGELTLVVEDIVTTGGSAAEVVAVVEEAGAKPVGVAVLADRSETPPRFALTALVRFPAVSWPPEHCPLCAEGRPLDAPGSRHLRPS